MFRFVVYVENVINAANGLDKKRLHVKKHDMNNNVFKDIKKMMKHE